MTDPIIPVIVSQHAEEAAFLWMLRDNAVYAPHYALGDLVRLDGRVEAHLDGLRVAGDPGWELAKTAAAAGAAGAVFAAAVLALEGGKDDRITFVVEQGCATPAKSRGLVSALGWLPYSRVKDVIRSLCTSPRAPLKRVGIAAAAVHRQHPDFTLARALIDNDPLLRRRVLQAVGEFGATDVLTTLKPFLANDDPALRFWAAWSGTLVYGDPAALAALQAAAKAGGRFAEPAADLAARRMDVGPANRWRVELGATRAAIVAAGALGDPDALPWLVEQMKSPPSARLAGEAFAAITGAHLAYDKLDAPKPEGFEPKPNDNPADEDVSADPDENLPWPHVEKVQKWLQTQQASFARGVRHLFGKPIAADALRQVLRDGRQRQRAAAALELSLLKRGTPLWEVRAPGPRQREWLG
jgi:uncharacterized protein (TIGR02270 family)